MQKADIRYVHYWLMSQTPRKYIFLNARGSSGTMKKITIEMVKNIPFPTQISKEEQYQRANILEEKLKIAKELIFASESEAEQARSLRNSILNRVFNGFIPPTER